MDWHGRVENVSAHGGVLWTDPGVEGRDACFKRLEDGTDCWRRLDSNSKDSAQRNVLEKRDRRTHTYHGSKLRLFLVSEQILGIYSVYCVLLNYICLRFCGPPSLICRCCAHKTLSALPMCECTIRGISISRRWRSPFSTITYTPTSIEAHFWSTDQSE